MGQEVPDANLLRHPRVVQLEPWQVLHDPVVPRSVIDRQPVLLTQPASSYARAVRQVAGKLLAHSPELPPILGDQDEDLAELSQEFTGS